MQVVSGIFTLVLIIVFLAIWAWAWSSKNKEQFSKMANLPLSDDGLGQSDLNVTKDKEVSNDE